MMIGNTISHYRIIEKLGEGGMGVVYKARDLKLDRFVALKFLPLQLRADEAEKKRFIHEAKAASALDHSNICTIYEINETDDKQMYIAMACYEGETLKDKIHRGPLKLNEALDIALQVTDGLKEAHEKDIVHRDIKSANIMVTGRGQAKIMDFGLAKLAGVTKLTKTGTTLGTAAYMSPEQTRGEEVDRRSDIWSMGVVLYEMITGQLPFKGEYEQAVVYSIVNQAPEPLTSLRTGVPMELERIVCKCLEKKIADRYQHADELIVDLRKVKQRPDSNKSPSIRAVRKKSFILPMILILALMIVAGFFIIKQFSSVTEHDLETPSLSHWENSIAVLPFENISPDPDQEYFCDGMTEQIINNLSQFRNLKIISRTSVMKFKSSTQTIPEIATVLNVKYILEGSVRKSRDRIRVTAQLINAEDDSHVWADDFDRVLADVFELQDDISEKIVSALLQELPAEELKKMKTQSTGNIEAYEYYLRGKYYHEKKFLVTVPDEESFKLSEMMHKKAIALDSNFALPHVALADLYHSAYIRLANDSHERQEYLKLQNDYLNEAFRLDSTLAYNYLMKGRIHQINNEIDGAFQCFKKAVELDPNSGWMNYSLGIFLHNRGLCYKAIPYADKAIELDPMVPNFFTSRGFSYQYLGHFKEAEKDYQKALELESNLVRALEGYTDLLIENKRLKEAETFFARLDTTSQYLKRLQAKYFAAKGERKKALILMGSNENVQIFSLSGMKEEAISLINNSLDRDKKLRTSYYLLYESNPCYDNLRGDSRFEALLAEHKKIYEENLQKYADVAAHSGSRQ